MVRKGNPNQRRIVEELKRLGYNVTVRHNQIHVDNLEPMTVTTAKHFLREIQEGG